MKKGILFEYFNLETEWSISAIKSSVKSSTVRPWSLKAIANRERTRSIILGKNIFVLKPMLFLFDREPTFWLRLKKKDKLTVVTARYLNPFKSAGIGFMFVVIYLLMTQLDQLTMENIGMILGAGLVIVLFSTLDSIIFRDWSYKWKVKTYNFIKSFICKRISVI